MVIDEKISEKISEMWKKKSEKCEKNQWNVRAAESIKLRSCEKNQWKNQKEISEMREKICEMW